MTRNIMNNIGINRLYLGTSLGEIEDNIFVDIYIKISDFIDSSQRKGEDMISYLSSMKDVLNNSTINRNDIEKRMLEHSIDNTIGIINAYHVEYSKAVLMFVSNLQEVIEDKYYSLNSFLKGNNIKVGNIFADISRITGHLIDSENIKDIS